MNYLSVFDHFVGSAFKSLVERGIIPAKFEQCRCVTNAYIERLSGPYFPHLD